MGMEIERKFLVTSTAYRQGPAEVLRQGYLSVDPERTVRVRVKGERARLTIKGRTVGASRRELEYEIPLCDALTLLEMCVAPLIEKSRYVVEHHGHTWEIDEFQGANAGLVVAEIELRREDEPFDKPSWVGEEVTADPRYYNANLVAQPYCRWAGGPHQAGPAAGSGVGR